MSDTQINHDALIAFTTATIAVVDLGAAAIRIAKKQTNTVTAFLAITGVAAAVASGVYLEKIIQDKNAETAVPIQEAKPITYCVAGSCPPPLTPSQP